MGFFSKLWKGVKKGFKAIFKPIKGLFKKVGKFMGKLGIAGQIALMFIPFGQMLGPMMQGFAKFGGKLLTGLKGMGAVGNAAATVIGKGVEFASMAKAGFDTVTNAVTGFFKTTGKWIGGKLGMSQYKGLTWDKAWGEYSQSLTNSWEKLGSKATEFWDTDIKGATSPYTDSVAKRYAVDSSVKDTVQQGLDSGLFEATDANMNFANKTYVDRSIDSGMIDASDAGYTDMSIPDVGIDSPAPKSLLSKGKDYVTELPGKMADNLVMTGLSQAAMGAIQGDPEVDMSPMWGARRGAGIEDFTASIGYQPTNYQQYVVDSTSASIVPPQFQQYGGGTNFWEQLMAQYNRPVSATA
jgi:hypothetical protein